MKKLYITQRDQMHVPPEVLDKLYIEIPDNEEEDVWRDEKREQTSNMLLRNLMRDYEEKARKKGRVWDWVSQQEFHPTPKAPAVSQLYRHYFHKYPAREILPDLMRGYEEFGIAAVSMAMSEWATEFYAPQNVIGMMNLAKRRAAQFVRGEPPPLPVDDIFLREEEKHDDRTEVGQQPKTQVQT